MTMTTLENSAASWEEQTAHQEPQSLEESAERVSQLFATTITSLAADVHALKHLTTWKDIVDENEENGGSHDGRREEFLESLCDLDDVVTAVEKKVGVLRQIVSEEQRALENLNLLHKDSQEQNENLKHLVDRCRNMKVTTTNNNNNKVAKENKPKSLSTKALTQPPASRKPTKPSVSSVVRAPLSTTSTTLNSASSHEQHAHVEGLECFFDPVTVEELESVPRTTRGRVQVHVLCEALDNIKLCFHKKAVKVRRQQRLLKESRQAALGRSQQAPEEQMDDEELLQNLLVTEQELRNSCKFFLAGEGTARTVLAVLKALKRIKQVRQKKKGLFMYGLCLD